MRLSLAWLQNSEGIDKIGCFPGVGTEAASVVLKANDDNNTLISRRLVLLPYAVQVKAFTSPATPDQSIGAGASCCQEQPAYEWFLPRRPSRRNWREEQRVYCHVCVPKAITKK